MCRRCTECEGYSHHWVPNMAFGDDGEENNQAAYECKHCNAFGDECRECYGDGCDQAEDGHDSVCGGCDGECSQASNKARSLHLLRAKLARRDRVAQSQQRNVARGGQIGSGMRSDKVRTVQVQNGKVTQHSTGRKMSYANYRKGKIDQLGT